MLNMTALVLIGLWIIGLINGHTFGGSIHILVVMGIIVFLYKSSRRPHHFEKVPLKNK
jgi:hypothetical protein